MGSMSRALEHSGRRTNHLLLHIVPLLLLILPYSCRALIMMVGSRPTVRRSARLLVTKADKPEAAKKVPKTKAVKKQDVKAAPTLKKPALKLLQPYLPRTIETTIKARHANVQYVIGVDEAGRGPLAGPVVAAAAIVPINIDGVIDSKKITQESTREELYDQITASDASFAIAIVDAAQIDKVNILQATMQAMTMAVNGLLSSSIDQKIREEASIEHVGCYIVRKLVTSESPIAVSNSYALIDGNRVPSELPIPGEAVVKGDGKEYAIAAASILAKVTRDRLMNAYADKYPDYSWLKNKGYPTAAHMDAIRNHGATPIHRFTFAPLKYMEFDKDNKVLNENAPMKKKAVQQR